jgi:hypothetical protein
MRHMLWKNTMSPPSRMTLMVSTTAPSATSVKTSWQQGTGRQGWLRASLAADAVPQARANARATAHSKQLSGPSRQACAKRARLASHGAAAAAPLTAKTSDGFFSPADSVMASPSMKI